MRRRTLLAALATTAGTAGCVQDGTAPGGRPTDENPTTDTDTPHGHTDTRTATDTPPEPPDATDVFADFECPSFTANADETVCYHRADAASADLLLTAAPEVFDPYLGDDDVETLRFRLYNRSGWPVGLNPYEWGIERYDEGAWTHVAPDAYPEPWVHVESGATMRWVLPSESRPEPEGEDAYQLGVALDPGVYAFHVTVAYGGEMDTPTDAPKPADRVELVALFTVEQAVDPSRESTATGATATGST